MSVIKFRKKIYKVNGIDNLVSELISYERAYNSYLKVFRKNIITIPSHKVTPKQKTRKFQKFVEHITLKVSLNMTTTACSNRFTMPYVAYSQKGNVD